MEYKYIIYDVKDKTAYITFNREKEYNAMNIAFKLELEDAVGRIENDRNIWGVIITGRGKAFNSGTDIGEFPTEVEDARRITDFSQKLLNRIESLQKPVIAAINGYALGGGLELAMAADIRVSSEKAKLGFPEVKIGAIPCYGGTQRLARLVGTGRAKEIIFTGRMVSAEEALSMGLVNYVTPPGEELTKAEELMNLMLRNSPVAINYAKLCITEGADLPVERAQYLEQTLVSMLIPTADLKEGTRAFLEKREPIFKNC